MAVELNKLYTEIYDDYRVRLLTTSCFGMSIDWIHVIEDESFADLLHGNELIFNSSLNYASEQKRITVLLMP